MHYFEMHRHTLSNEFPLIALSMIQVVYKISITYFCEFKIVLWECC